MKGDCNRPVSQTLDDGSRRFSIFRCSLYIYTNILTHIWRARGIQYRCQGEEPVVGLFSQIGDLYTVHHVWGKLFSPEWTVAARANFIRELMEQVSTQYLINSKVYKVIHFMIYFYQIYGNRNYPPTPTTA